jgi:hypothetical protein
MTENQLWQLSIIKDGKLLYNMFMDPMVMPNGDPCAGYTLEGRTYYIPFDKCKCGSEDLHPGTESIGYLFDDIEHSREICKEKPMNQYLETGRILDANQK